MDSEMCLLNAELYIMDRDAEHAAMSLNEYADWRHRGGHEPISTHFAVKGDEFHRHLVRRFEDAFRCTYLDGKV